MNEIARIQNYSSSPEVDKGWLSRAKNRDGVAIAMILMSAGLSVTSIALLAMAVITKRVDEIGAYMGGVNLASEALIQGSLPYMKTASLIAMTGAQIAFYLGAGISVSSND